jgi:hypothetical protein
VFRVSKQNKVFTLSSSPASSFSFLSVFDLTLQVIMFIFDPPFQAIISDPTLLVIVIFLIFDPTL